MRKTKICGNVESSVMGLDLSLRAPAAVVIPGGWDPGDWGALRSCVFDTSGFEKSRGGVAKFTERDGIERIVRISEMICSYAAAHSVTHVFIEGYAFSKKFQAHQLGELGGVVRRDLLMVAHLPFATVPATSARKYLVGTIKKAKKGEKRVNVKEYVQNKLMKMGAPFRTADEGDAFVVANFGLSELGLCGLSAGE